MGQSFRFCFEVRVPSTSIAMHFASIDFERSRHDPIEHVAIVRDQDQGAAVLFTEIRFEPFDRVGIEVIGRFIENCQAGLFDQKPCKRDSSSFAPAHLVHAAIDLVKIELLKQHIDPAAVLPSPKPLHIVCSDGLGFGVRFPPRFLRGDQPAERLMALECFCPGAEPLEHDLSRRSPGGQWRLLWEVADARFSPACDPTLVCLLLAEENAGQRRLSRSIVPHEADPLPLVNRQVDTVQKTHLPVCFTQTFSDQDGHARLSARSPSASQGGRVRDGKIASGVQSAADVESAR